MIDVRPDKGFIDQVKSASGSDLSTCMQCGSCTAACGLSGTGGLTETGGFSGKGGLAGTSGMAGTGERYFTGELFPRKEMIWSAWGQKESLMRDRNLWLCHQCGDCTQSCPRGISPGDVLAVLRAEVMQAYARPGVLFRLVSGPAYLPLITGVPVLIISLILVFAGTFSIPEGPVDYSAFFPHTWLNISFSLLFFLSAGTFIASIRSYWNDLSAGRSKDESAPGSFRLLLGMIPEVIFHERFTSCKSQRHRYFTHLAVFWGFVILLVVTFFAILSTLFFSYPLGFLNPIKIAGNAGGLILVCGSLVMLYQRLTSGSSMNSRFTDWFFLSALFLLGISGFLVEGARFGNWNSAYHIYFVHLVLVWLVILYLPYTKFAHFVYRLAAMVHARKYS